MRADIEKLALTRLIRKTIELVLKDNPAGLRMQELCSLSCKRIQWPLKYDQIERQRRKMADVEVSVDRTPPRNYIYSWAYAPAKSGTEPQHSRAVGERAKVADMDVIQRTVPAAAGLFTAGHWTPIEWCVDVIASMAAVGAM